MKLVNTLLIPIFLLSFISLSAQTQSKKIHKEVHTQLLANAKTGIDKSVLDNYLRLDLEAKENIDPIYGNLSSESIEMISDLLKEARSHTGKRYRYGAKGPYNFDCSGFTGYVFRQFGYNLNASSRGQYSDGESVATEDLRPGDLVFFTSPRSNGAVGHVGIVVSADKETNNFTFIHASISGGIQEDKSTAPYYQKRYVGARRIITE